MKYIAAVLLAHMSTNGLSTEVNCKNALDAIMAEYDESRLENVIAELQGKDLEDLIAKALPKIQTSSSSTSSNAASSSAAAEKPAEEEKKEEEEAAAPLGLDDMFGDW